MKTFIYITLFTLCLGSAEKSCSQQSQQAAPLELRDLVPAHFKRELQARINKPLAVEAEEKHVRFVYLVPADKEEKPEYKLSIENAARHLQLWYKNQLGNNRSFNLYDPVVEVYKTSHNESWYSTNPDADWAGEWKFWFNEVNDAFSLTGGSFEDPNNFWIIYIDALPACPLLQGGGLSHVAAMGVNDLRGLVGLPWLPICDEYVPDYSPCRYVGGLGHELGHAFGVPHPPGCDDGQPVSCDYNSIMYTGYLNYPNTYFSQTEKTTINASAFINEVDIGDCQISCTSLVDQYFFSKTVEISICPGESYFAGGSLQTTAGIYTDTFSSRLGCDSVVTTDLKILPVFQKTVEASICAGESYFAGGSLQTTAGVYTDTFSSKLGCDSTVTTNLKILPVFQKTVEASICPGESYFAGGSLQTTAGVYTDTFSSKLGCDSTVTTNLKILPVFQKTVEASICPGENYFAGGSLQTTAGVYTDTFSSKLGCDSTVTTNLKILPVFQKTVEASICPGESYFAGGSLQTAAGIYTDTFSSTLGCDSIVTTDLKVINVYEKTVEASICPGEEYFAGGSLQTKPGVYMDTFSSTLGCDSIIVTNLILGICTDIESDFDNSVKIYPVPTNGILFVESPNLHHEELFNSLGKHVLSAQGNYIDFADLPEGYYYLRVFSSSSEFVNRKILFMR
jgi:hypothetical protein